jgi:hypothetical protein
VKHHLLPAATALGLVGLSGVVLLTINENNASLYQTYFALIALLVPALVVIGQWWRERHKRHQARQPGQPPAPLPPNPPAPPVVVVSRGRLARLGRLAIEPATVIIAVSAGLSVDITLSLLNSPPRHAALTALGTAVAAYLVYLAIVAATDRV